MSRGVYRQIGRSKTGVPPTCSRNVHDDETRARGCALRDATKNVLPLHSPGVFLFSFHRTFCTCVGHARSGIATEKEERVCPACRRNYPRPGERLPANTKSRPHVLLEKRVRPTARRPDDEPKGSGNGDACSLPQRERSRDGRPPRERLDGARGRRTVIWFLVAATLRPRPDRKII